MTKAAQLAAELDQVNLDQGMKTIEAQAHTSLHYDVIDDVMCIMHSDGQST